MGSARAAEPMIRCGVVVDVRIAVTAISTASRVRGIKTHALVCDQRLIGAYLFQKTSRDYSTTREQTIMYARRTVLKGAAGLSLATILADPMLASAAAADLEKISITTQGGRSVSAALAVPSAAKAPAILLVHEW